ncbi:MAG: triose-phosphate isomerase [Neptunomonas phycophila]|uniref:triose-phosphate isomerase n=1 Tax=Neptunomonas phycophila TaxID=1572645 RepID=UPI003B8CD865
MRKLIVAGNWKMNGTKQLAADMVHALKETSLPADVSVVVFPPSILVGSFVDCSGCKTGIQNINSEPSGAYTGELSASMVKEAGCSYVLVGHSERRSLFGEQDDVVAAKVKAAVDNGLMPMLCVGETLEQREAGDYLAVIKSQVVLGLSRLSIAELEKVTLAYEPVWAIGTGRTATPEQAQNVHASVREVLAEEYSRKVADEMSILYGGSVNAKSAGALFAQPDIDGGLVGGASLKVNEFLTICSAAADNV